jgi:DnaJ-class molecular chaperone
MYICAVCRFACCLQIKGEGMPIFGQEPKRGDLWIHYTVAFPASLTEQQKQSVRDLFPA